MENFYRIILEDIANCFVKPSQSEKVKPNYRSIASLIRIHEKNFSEAGEASFPCNPALWKKYFPDCDVNSGALVDVKCGNYEHFLAEASKWLFPVSHLNIRSERCHLHLQRRNVAASLIQQVLTDENYGRLWKSENKFFFLKPLEVNDLRKDQNLSYYRAKLVHRSLEKLMVYSRYPTVQELKSSHIAIEVASAISCFSKDNNTDKHVVLNCGPVIYHSIDEEVGPNLTTEQYLSCRSDHIRKMSLFRSRKSVTDDACFNALNDHLGGADVTVSLLEVKHTSPVQIRSVGMGSTKGAVFLLYNSARLATILRTFSDRIRNNEYDEQPEMKSIDWSVLNEDEEWHLVFTYIAGFPDVIDRCMEQLERGMFAVHLIIHFLNGLVSLFSKYYIRIRILTEKRDQLMPYVYARIYLLQAVRKILNRTLGFLDITPVESM